MDSLQTILTLCELIICSRKGIIEHTPFRVDIVEAFQALYFIFCRLDSRILSMNARRVCTKVEFWGEE